MLIKHYASVAILAMAIPTAYIMAAEEGGSTERIDATGTLPDAKPGECYAKVIVPAEYETKTEEVLVKPESEVVEIVPATFDAAEKEVSIKDGFTRLKAVPAKFRTETEEIEISPAYTEWVTSLDNKGFPASPALLAGAKSNGVDIDNSPVGACYREYYVPAQFETTEKEVLVKEESEEIKIADAQFEKTEETVVVKPASKKKVLKPAEYEEIEEKIEIEPAKAVWKKGDGPITKIDNSTGEIMCLIQVPAKYKTIKKTVLKSESVIDLVDVPEETAKVEVQKLISDATVDKIKIPAEYTKVKVTNKVADARFMWIAGDAEGEGKFTGNQVCLKEVPAQYEKVEKQVVDSAATVEEEKVAPEMTVVKVSNLATEAQEVRTKIAAEFKMVEKRNKVANERLEWQRVLCKTNMGPDINKRIQQALKDAGYYNGTIDGSIGRGTLGAVERYQKENDLPIGGLTIQVLEKLGVL